MTRKTTAPAHKIFSEYYIDLLNLNENDEIEFDGKRGVTPNGIRFICTEGLPAFEDDDGFEEDWARLSEE